jgi:hypothetical protein
MSGELPAVVDGRGVHDICFLGFGLAFARPR